MILQGKSGFGNHRWKDGQFWCLFMLIILVCSLYISSLCMLGHIHNMQSKLRKLHRDLAKEVKKKAWYYHLHVFTVTVLTILYVLKTLSSKLLVRIYGLTFRVKAAVQSPKTTHTCSMIFWYIYFFNKLKLLTRIMLHNISTALEKKQYVCEICLHCCIWALFLYPYFIIYTKCVI